MSILTDEEVKEIRLSIPAVCHHADLIQHTGKLIASKFSALLAENEALHTKLAQFTKWNYELTAKCNWYNCDGARLEREIEALKQQVVQGKRDAVPEDIRKDAERYRWIRKCMPFSTYEKLTLKRDAKSYDIDTKLDAAIDAGNWPAAPKQEK